MKEHTLLETWLKEERVAHIHGWDFSHIQKRYSEESDLPWDYKKAIQNRLKRDTSLLDIDTGGGEFLLSLHHPNTLLSATEGYPPNVELCRQTLIPLGIHFKESDGMVLPFANASFDMVINRHGDYDEKEVFRVLKKDGWFISEQVGAENDRDLVELLLSDKPPIPFPHQYLNKAVKRLRQTGFMIHHEEEAYRPILFYDVGALVWYARIIEWEFPDFSVKQNFQQLLKAQKILEKNGVLQGRIHRYFFIAKK